MSSVDCLMFPDEDLELDEEAFDISSKIVLEVKSADFSPVNCLLEIERPPSPLIWS